MNKKVINKGYTLEVVSWENDGDNYRIKSVTVDTIEEAENIYNMCKTLFKPCNNGDGGVGNSMEGEANQVLYNYVTNNKSCFPDLKDEDDILNYFNDLTWQLMGSSEYYDFRVCESCTCYYSPEDIYLEEIKF